MTERDLAQGTDELRELVRRGADAEPSAVVLDEVHARAPVAGVHHQHDGPHRREDLAQVAQAGRGVLEVVQHPGADHEVERLAERADLLDRQAQHLEVVHTPTLGQGTRVLDAGRTHVDADDACAGVAQRVAHRLRSAAAGHEHRFDRCLRSGRPDEVVRDPARPGIVGWAVGCSGVADRRRVRMPFVEGLDRVRPRLGRRSGAAHELIMPAFSFSITLSMLNDAGS